MLCATAYTFAYTLATRCAYALMYVQFVHLALGDEDEGVRLVYESTPGGSVCGCMCVYTQAHTHAAQIGYSVVSPGVGMRQLEGPKNQDGLNLGIHIFVYMYKVHVCMYMLGGGMRSWTN